MQELEAYLDIETTGLSPAYHQITVVGICLADADRTDFVQLVGPDVTRDNLANALHGASTLYTYNGSRFDIPFISQQLGVDLALRLQHCDLMYDCWRNNLYGGLKAVERRLGIARKIKDISGFDAVRLWWQYERHSDREALATLLEYNREDVINLKTLREMLRPPLPEKDAGML